MQHTHPPEDRLALEREAEVNRLANSAPLDNWPTRDGKYVCTIAAGDGLFPRLVRAMGREELLADPRFTTLALRAEHGDVINAIVADWCRSRTAAEIADILVRHDVPFGVAYSAADIFADPHIAAREDLVAVGESGNRPVLLQGGSPRFSRPPRANRGGA